MARFETALDVIKKLGDKAGDQLVGTSVLANYGNEKNYVVESIEWKKKPTD